MSRLAMAMVAYAVLAALSLATLSDPRIRAATLLILALCAFKTWVRRKDVMHPDGESNSK
jgi:hypothetical protein